MSLTVATPRSLSEAVHCLTADPALRPVAGCTDLMVAGATQRNGMTGVIDMLRVPELRGVVIEADTVRIGATTSFVELRRHDELRRVLSCIGEAASVVGGWQIQTRATVGGNIATASPAGDSLPVWLALDATVVINGPRGQREVPYEQMHLDYRKTALSPGEIIERLHVRRCVPGTVLWFRKVGARQAQAISKVVIAGAITIEDGRVREARLAAGCVAPVPIRLRQVEQFLVGKAPSAEVAEEAGRLASIGASPIDDVRSTAAYRAHVLGRVIRRSVLDLANRHAENAV